MRKTKFQITGICLDLLKDSGEYREYPCAVCRKGAGSNSIACSRWKLRVHKKCCRLSGRQLNNPEYFCPRCPGLSQPIDGCTSNMSDVDHTTLHFEPVFCYEGDMLSAGGGCSSAIEVSCCSVWSRYRNILPVPTSKRISFRKHGKKISSCERSSFLN